MKILDSPFSPPPPNWWHHLQINCSKCHTKIELETLDRVEITAERHPVGKVSGKVTCPVPLCYNRIEFNKPT